MAIEAPIHQLVIHVTGKKRRVRASPAHQKQERGTTKKYTGDELTLRSPKESQKKHGHGLLRISTRGRLVSEWWKGGYLGGFNPPASADHLLVRSGPAGYKFQPAALECLGASCGAVTAASCMNATSQLVFTARMERMRWH